MPFKTDSERGFVITKLKTSGQLDPELVNNWPTIVSIKSVCVCVRVRGKK